VMHSTELDRKSSMSAFKIWEGEGKPGLGSYPVCNAKETEN
jgi:hypothetical protein